MGLRFRLLQLFNSSLVAHFAFAYSGYAERPYTPTSAYTPPFTLTLILLGTPTGRTRSARS